MGRPTEYSEELLKKAQDYLAVLPEGEVLPSIAGLSVQLGIARETIYAWASQEEKQDFSDIVWKILTKQERTLINKGLTGDFTPAITKLLLSKHGYSEKSEVDVTTKGQALNTNTEAEKAAAEAYAASLKPKE